jgi:uncharacterized protein (TIGR02300 family)
VAKSDLGTKRICPTTGKKFYDLNKNPVISPYTGEVVPIAPIPPPRTRADAAARASAAAAASAAEAVPEPSLATSAATRRLEISPELCSGFCVSRESPKARGSMIPKTTYRIMRWREGP